MSNMRLKIEFPLYSDYNDGIKSLINLFLEDAAVYFRAEFDWETDQLLHMSAMLYQEHTIYSYSNETELGVIFYDSDNDLFSPTHCIDGGASVNEPYDGGVQDEGKMDPARNLRCINSIGDINTVLAQANTYLRFYELDSHGGYYDYLSAFEIPETIIPVKITPYVNNEDVVDATDQLPSFLSDLREDGIVKVPIDKTGISFTYTFDLRTTSFSIKDLDTDTYYDVFYKMGIVKFSKGYYLETNISLPNDGEESIHWEWDPQTYYISKSEIIGRFLGERLSLNYSSESSLFLYETNIVNFPRKNTIKYADRLEVEHNQFPGKPRFSNIFIAPIVDTEVLLEHSYNYPCVGFMYMRLYNQDGTVCNLNLDNLELCLKESIDDSYTSFSDYEIKVWFTNQNMSGGFIPSMLNYYLTDLGSQEQDPTLCTKDNIYPLYLSDGSRAPYVEWGDGDFMEYFSSYDGKYYIEGCDDSYFVEINDNGYLSVQCTYRWSEGIQVRRIILNQSF